MVDYKAPIFIDPKTGKRGNFTWGEYALLPRFSQYAVPTEQERKNAIFLFQEVQKIRELIGHPIIITGGCRTSAYTKHLRANGIPAAQFSAHNEWRAVDISCPNMTNKELWDFCNKHWAGRMELLRYTPTWVHLDTRNWGSHQRFVP